MDTRRVLVIFEAKLIILSTFINMKLIKNKDTDKEYKTESGPQDSFKSFLCFLR